MTDLRQADAAAILPLVTAAADYLREIERLARHVDQTRTELERVTTRHQAAQEAYARSQVAAQALVQIVGALADGRAPDPEHLAHVPDLAAALAKLEDTA